MTHNAVRAAYAHLREFLSDTRPCRAFVDRGYRGHGIEATGVFVFGQRRGVTPALRRDLRRCSAIEPTIGYMKTDGRLARCPLKGTLGEPSTPCSAAAATAFA